jgi:hypothetical protein
MDPGRGHHVTPLPVPHAMRIIAGSRSRKGLATLTVAFDAPMNSGSAGDPDHYSVFGGVKHGKPTLYTLPLSIRGVSDEPGRHRVTITLSKPHKGPVNVIVRGGILGVNGASSSGDLSAVV